MTQTTEHPGQGLKVLRERARMTARDVAQKAKASEGYISRVENGLVNPSDAWVGHVAGIISDQIVENATGRVRGVAA